MSIETIGNWTVDQLTTDTISTAKSPTLVDLDYAADYTVTQRGPSTIELANTTGAQLTTVERLRYARNKVDDVYYLWPDISPDQRANSKAGTSLLSELTMLVKATNSVSGEEVLLPLRGRIVLVAPTVGFVGPNTLKLLALRTMSAVLGTGDTTGTMAVSMARGDLDPQS